MELPIKRPEKIKLKEINPYLTCYLCKGYLIDATTISECLHSFCRSCIIKFLQENSFCPVCEVIINKAKPNLKLDKTLQDVVYKLVPELFLREMTRRKQFYRQYPQVSVRVSPEERGEDTERTIFNPQDFISLSMEYVSDDSTPGAICLPGKNGLDKTKLTAEENQALMKRYLQCPGMCRVEVLKKFVRNKYNVDTNRFYIDVLYKRVPLPDHYTLIDIAYIYSWKRNEPMKFYFRITDITKVSERFDFFGASQTTELVVKMPTRSLKSGAGDRAKKRDSAAQKRIAKVSKQPSQESVSSSDKSSEASVGQPSDKCDNTLNNKDGRGSEVSETKGTGASDKSKVPDKDLVVGGNILLKPEIAELKNKIQNDGSDTKNSVYTNITLNRMNNVEIITKIQKVSNKEGQPIGLNIIKQTVKKGGKASTSRGSPKPTKEVPSESKKTDKQVNNNLSDVLTKNGKPCAASCSNLDEEKCKFFKSIELTAKNTTPNTSPKKSEASKQKRKPSSPVKNDKAKKAKPGATRIIIQSKPGDQKRNSGLQSLIDSCKINIPSSLSITIKESSENRLPALLPPVRNYIEILKLPDDSAESDQGQKGELASRLNDSEQKVDQDLSDIAKSLTEKIPMSTTVSQIVGPKPQFQIPVKSNKFHIQPSPVPEVPCKVVNVPKDNKLTPRSPQTFQKIFEESIKRPEGSPKSPEKDGQKSALDLTSLEPAAASNTKRNILEIASQLYKKTKLEQEKQHTDAQPEVPVPKVPIPRLPNQRSLKPRQKFMCPKFEAMDSLKQPQTLTNMHSDTLGMNYSISVGQKAPMTNGILNKETESAGLLVGSNSFVPPTESGASPRPKNMAARDSPKHSPKSSPVVKHMYAPTPNALDQLRVHTLNQKLPSPKSKLPSPSAKLPSSRSASPSVTSVSPKPSLPQGASPKTAASPSPSSSKTPPKAGSPLSPNQILEKYNIQNLAQLTASLNFNASNYGLNPGNQLAAFQHAMLLKHFEMHNRQNWLNMNQGPLVQYEKYLQSLKSNQNQLLGNIKEN